MPKLLDADSARLEADSHEERLRSPAWAGDGEDVDPATSGNDPVPSSRPNGALIALLARLDKIEQRLAGIEGALPSGQDDGWIEQVIESAATWDRPDPRRVAVGLRASPGLIDAIGEAGRALGLRTSAGAWELLVRLGLGTLARRR
jgi:hypothetical protein